MPAAGAVAAPAAGGGGGGASIVGYGVCCCLGPDATAASAAAAAPAERSPTGAPWPRPRSRGDCHVGTRCVIVRGERDVSLLSAFVRSRGRAGAGPSQHSPNAPTPLSIAEPAACTNTSQDPIARYTTGPRLRFAPDGPGILRHVEPAIRRLLERQRCVLIRM